MGGLKNKISIVFLFCGHLLFSQILRAPLFSFPAGFYSDSVIININSPDAGVTIRYTLDGSTPKITSAIFSTPLVMKDRTPQLNRFSNIPTNPGFNYPKPGYDVSRADSRGWLPPYGTVFKGTVLKALCFKAGAITTIDSVSTATYLITNLLNTRYSFPVLSISVDSAAFFSDSTGIYVYGIDTAAQGNYNVDKANRKIHIEFFETDGTKKLKQYCDARIHGNGGRHAPQKSLQLISSKIYGVKKFDYKFFKDKITHVFNRLLLRNGGHRPDCMPRDDIATEILKVSENNDVQHVRHAVVFLNGEYWGLQSIRDVFDDNYLANKFNLKNYNFVVLKETGTLDEGLPGDEIPYQNLLSFVQTNNLNIYSNYAQVREKIDLESFTDFQCSQIFLGNGDWPNNNTKFWRYKRAVNDTSVNTIYDGKWRWFIFDMDAAWGGDCTGFYPNFNAVLNAFDISYNSYTAMLRNLILNTSYKNYFINRFADLLNTTFLISRTTSIINSQNAELNPEMLEHVNRWRYPSVATTLLARSTETPSLTKWNAINSGMLNFASQRPAKTYKHFLNYFLLADTVKTTLNVNDSTKGKIRINSLYLDKWLVGANPNVYPWKGTYFDGNKIQLEAIAKPGFKFLNWSTPSYTTTNLNLNVTQDTNITAVFAVDSSFKPLHYVFINEIMASNTKGIADDYNEKNDWIEIYNPNNFTINLSDYYLTDSVNNKTKFQISTKRYPTHNIKPKGFLLLWADNDVEQGSLHCNFKLSLAAGCLYLILPDGKTVVDSICYPTQKSDISWGREKDGADKWIDWDVPTPNASNLKIIKPPYIGDLLLYPNPVKNGELLNFTYLISANVFNVLGQKVSEINNSNILNVESFASGFYFVKIIDGPVLKFIKIN